MNTQPKPQKKEKVSAPRLLNDLKRFADSCAGQRVVCFDLRNNACFVNDLEENDEFWKMSMSYYTNFGEDFTVGVLLEALEDWCEAESYDETGLLGDVRFRFLTPDEEIRVLYLLPDAEGHIFAEYTYKGEDVVACRGIGAKETADGEIPQHPDIVRKA